jgi:beta-galactosidase
MKLFSGKLVVLVKSKITEGDIKLEVNSAGLKSGKLTLNATK